MDKVRFLMSDTSADVTAACREALEAQEAAEAEEKKNAKGSGLLQGGALKSEEDKPEPMKKKAKDSKTLKRPKLTKKTKKMENKS